ncbi:MAG: DUF1573 domain-containing protein [Flavobacteriales bacterium]|nr:DUF1573 domain-containing protein [Flavobacteriales bacterium]
MKKAVLSFAFVLGAAIAMIAQSEVTTGPAISLDKEVHDYGTIQQGGDGACEFIVTNTGTEPLIISKCKGSCGCTVPKCDKNPILPGETSAISVKYDTKRVGPINKSVTITSNATNEPTKVIRIKGTVEGDPNAQPASPVKVPSEGAPVNKQ